MLCLICMDIQDGDHSLCCCLICIGSSDRHRNHRDSGGVPWLCCWDCGSRRRRTSSSEGQWRPDPKQNGTKKEEKEKKKETGTCCSSHGPFDISPRYKHQHDSSDWNKTKHQCSRCSSIPPSPLDPPRIQQFGRLDHEKRVIGHGMYYQDLMVTKLQPSRYIFKCFLMVLIYIFMSKSWKIIKNIYKLIHFQLKILQKPFLSILGNMFLIFLQLYG